MWPSLPLESDDNDEIGFTGDGDGGQGVQEPGEEQRVALARTRERPLKNWKGNSGLFHDFFPKMLSVK